METFEITLTLELKGTYSIQATTESNAKKLIYDKLVNKNYDENVFDFGITFHKSKMITKPASRHSSWGLTCCNAAQSCQH
jgi:hypothetical protein